MKLLDIFQKKHRAKQAEKEKIKRETRSEKAEPEGKVPARGFASIKESKLASEVLLSPHVTEKSAYLSESLIRKDISGGQYVFKIADKANKPMIKRAVEEAYGVKVEKVRILPQRDKTTRIRGIMGKKRGAKRALVILEKGGRIEFV